MEKILKPANVHMLATDKPSPIVLEEVGINKTKLHLYNGRAGKWNWQHLYFTDDSEIKEGDWCINPKEHLAQYITDSFYGEWKKVIATTNPRLWAIRDEEGYISKELKFNIPKIPTSFIEQFVKAEGKITQVMLEYVSTVESGGINWKTGNVNNPYSKHTDKLKLTPNGEVIVHTSEPKMYSEEEVRRLMYMFLADHPLDRGIQHTKDSFEKWFNENK